MTSQFDRKADDWVLAAHIMLKKTTNNHSGVAFKLGSPSLKVAAQLSILGSISGSNIPTSLDYVSLSSVFLRNFTGKPFSVHDINGLRGNVSQGTKLSSGGRRRADVRRVGVVHRVERADRDSALANRTIHDQFIVLRLRIGDPVCRKNRRPPQPAVARVLNTRD